VRELAYFVQIELLRAARKRMEKHLPKLVGSWLAGIYDRDRGVARSASEGILSLLDTDAKITAFWTKYQSQILEYAKETFKETPQSLSDERTVSEDEMQEKYFRVVNSSISLVINLFVNVNQADIDKHQRTVHHTRSAHFQNTNTSNLSSWFSLSFPPSLAFFPLLLPLQPTVTSRVLLLTENSAVVSSSLMLTHQPFLTPLDGKPPLSTTVSSSHPSTVLPTLPATWVVRLASSLPLLLLDLRSPLPGTPGQTPTRVQSLV